MSTNERRRAATGNNNHGPDTRSGDPQRPRQGTYAQQQQEANTPPPDMTPNSLEAEEGVIGSLLLQPGLIDEVADSLTPDDFYDDRLRWIYAELVAAMNRGTRSDVTLLAERLRAVGRYEAVGGAVALAKLMNGVPHHAHLRYYASVVRDKAMLRAVINAGGEAVRNAATCGNRPAIEVVAECEHLMYHAAERGMAADARPQQIADVLAGALEEITARCEGRSRSGTLTGYTGLDDMLGGLRRREVSVIGGRPGHGKTSLGTAIALNAARVEGANTLVISLEMAGTELAERLLSSDARVDLHRMRTGTLSMQQRGILHTHGGLLATTTMWIEDCPQRTSTQIGAIARRHKRTNGGLDLIIIDYLQLIHPDNERDPRQEQVAKVSRRLKIMARELDCHVMVLAQVNRSAGDTGRAPKLSELRESGAIEQDADVVMFVHRPAEYDPAQRPADPTAAEQAEIHVAKHRNGPTGIVKVHWFRRFARFDNAAADTQAGGAEWQEQYGATDQPPAGEARPAQAAFAFPPLPEPPPEPRGYGQF